MPEHPTIRLTRIPCYDEPADRTPHPEPHVWTVVLEVGRAALVPEAPQAQNDPDEDLARPA